MDPFSSEGELVNVHTAYIQGRYQNVLDDFDPNTFSESNHLAVRILHYRANCALGNARAVFDSISESDAASSPDLAAARCYAQFLAEPASPAPLATAESLAAQSSDNLSVQLLCGTVLARTGKSEQALALLSKHQGSLDAVALSIQIQLSLNRTDLALKEAAAARSFAQDALLVNLAESWISLRQGGADNYQKAFYVFEELAQAPSSTSPSSLVAQAVSELHLGRLDEAQVALQQALDADPSHPDALANQLVLDTILAKPAEEIAGVRSKLEAANKEHEILKEIAAKREAFQTAMAKYSPKFEP